MEAAAKSPQRAENDTARSNPNGSCPAGDSTYARDLRVVGQMLESHSVVTADLIFVAGTYIIQGRVTVKRYPGLTINLLKNSLAWAKSGFSKHHQAPPENLTLRCSLEELRELDSDARRRRTTDKGMPDPYALSQKLRSAGAYLDTRKRSSLIGILLREREITIRFESSEGRLEETRRDVDYFYDCWVKMYLKRSERLGLDGLSAKLPGFLQN